MSCIFQMRNSTMEFRRCVSTCTESLVGIQSKIVTECFCRINGKFAFVTQNTFQLQEIISVSRDAQFEIGIEFGPSFGMIKQLACWLAVLSSK